MIRCPVCGWQAAEGFSVEEQVVGYTVYRCPRCDVRFAWPFRAPPQVFYAPQAGEEWRLNAYLVPLWFLWAGRPLPLSSAHRTFLARVPVRGKRVLDVGSGECTFLRAVQQRGGEAWGLDPSPNGQRFCTLQGVRRFFPGTLEAFHQQHPHLRFHVITLFEVLEHLDRPRETLELLYRMLVPGGHLGISVPDETRTSLRLGLPRFPQDYPPHHLTRWTPRALRYALEHAGFRILSHLSLPPDPGYSIARRLPFPTTTERFLAWLRSPPPGAHVRWKILRVWDGLRWRDQGLRMLLWPLQVLLRWARIRGLTQLVIAQKPKEAER